MKLVGNFAKRRLVLFATVFAMSAAAVAQVGTRTTERKTAITLVTGVAATCLAANTARHGFTIIFETTAGIANAHVAYFATSTNGGTTQTATSSNGTPMPGGSSWGEDGSGNSLYGGAVSVIGTTGDGCQAREW